MPHLRLAADPFGVRNFLRNSLEWILAGLAGLGNAAARIGGVLIPLWLHPGPF